MKKTKTGQEIFENLQDIINDSSDNNVQLFWYNDKVQKKLKKILGLKEIEHTEKRNRSSYIFFFKHKRTELLKEYPNITCQEIMKIVGNEWKNLSDEDRQVFIDQAKNDKERYNTYKNSESGKTTYNTSENKEVKKCNLNSYIKFCKENRPIIKQENLDLSTREITSKLSKLWKYYKENDVNYLIDKFGYSCKIQNNVSFDSINEIKEFVSQN